MAGIAPATSAPSVVTGELRLLGRKKEMIVLANGQNVFPQDVEDVLRLRTGGARLCGGRAIASRRSRRGARGHHSERKRGGGARSGPARESPTDAPPADQRRHHLARRRLPAHGVAEGQARGSAGQAGRPDPGACCRRRAGRGGPGRPRPRPGRPSGRPPAGRRAAGVRPGGRPGPGLAGAHRAGRAGRGGPGTQSVGRGRSPACGRLAS